MEAIKEKIEELKQIITMHKNELNKLEMEEKIKENSNQIGK